MKKNSAILIDATRNGYLVRPDMSHGSSCGPELSLVFQSFAELQAFLEGHFDHRKANLINDMEST